MNVKGQDTVYFSDNNERNASHITCFNVQSKHRVLVNAQAIPSQKHNQRTSEI
jgi:hypothetical protein